VWHVLDPAPAGPAAIAREEGVGEKLAARQALIIRLCTTTTKRRDRWKKLDGNIPRLAVA
jgi:hypothetical protein